MINSNKKNPYIGCEPMIFSELFHKGRFEVPWHQRRYDWKKEHVSDLLNDIDEAIREKRKCYFLGAIMLVQRGDDLWEINDGQQRMVTFSLICACLCDLFRGEDSHCEGLALRVNFNLGPNEIKSLSDADELTPRLSPPSEDKTRYNLMIRGKNIGTNGKLTAAWKAIDDFIAPMGLEKAKEFLDFLLNKVEVACLWISEENVDPNSVFETINCRGKKLEDFDLIRNNLYSYFNPEEERNRRDTVHENIERIRMQIGSDAKAAHYSRCYFQCRYGFLAKDSFYKIARNKIRHESDKLVEKGKKHTEYVFQLVADFASMEQIALFRHITHPDANSTFVEGFLRDSQTKNSVRNLSIFLQELSRYKIAQPVIFALLCKYVQESNLLKKRQVAKYVNSGITDVTSFIMRTAFVVSKFESSHYESEFSNFAEKIWAAKSLETLSVKDFLKECDNSNEGIMNNKKFIGKMKDAEIKNNQKAKALLWGINCYEQQDGEIINEKNCTLEHILPKSEKHWSGWVNFSETHQDWVYRIGNLTLLGQSDNKPGDNANRSFAGKKEFLGRSAISLNKKLVNYNDWSPDRVEKRQEKLSELAAVVWSFSKSRKRPLK